MSNVNANLFSTRAQQDFNDAMSMGRAYQQMGAQPYIKRKSNYFHLWFAFMPFFHCSIMQRISFRIIFISPIRLLEAIFNDPVHAIPKVFCGLLYEVAALVLHAIMVMVSLVSCIIKTLSTIYSGYRVPKNMDLPVLLITFLANGDDRLYNPEETIVVMTKKAFESSWA